MSLPQTHDTTLASPRPPGDVLAVLEQVRGAFHPGTRLFAAHRRNITAAIEQAGLSEDSPTHACIALTLSTAETYEADGMYAFLPTWDLLLTRVARLGSSDGDSEA